MSSTPRAREGQLSEDLANDARTRWGDPGPAGHESRIHPARLGTLSVDCAHGGLTGSLFRRFLGTEGSAARQTTFKLL
jgi:hypothetical protein